MADDVDFASLEDEVMLGPALTVVMKPATAIAIAALVQLALRHPGIEGVAEVAPLGRIFVHLCKRHFKDYPTISKVLAQGERQAPTPRIHRPGAGG